MSRVLSGAEIRDGILADLQERARGRPRPPGLAVVLVGEDPASAVYVRNKEKACERVGFAHRTFRYPATAAQAEVLDRVRALNEDPEVDGILVQLPLPRGLDAEAVIGSIDPRKDVDGLHPANLGRLLAGRPSFVPCTPAGIVRLLAAYKIGTAGRRVAIVGRSVIVGRSLAALLSLKGPRGDATVTLCHSATVDLPAVVREAEIVVAAVGAPGALDRRHVDEGAVVVDVGINRLPDAATPGKSRLCGDVAPAALEGWASAYTPVPGGVGLMTIAMLLENTWQAYAGARP